MKTQDLEKNDAIALDKYRVENNSVFEYSEDHNAYIHCGKLNGRTLEQAIEDFERFEIQS